MSDSIKYKENTELNDAWVNGMVDAALMLNSRLSKYDFEIIVKDRVVTLFGEVNTLIDKWLCIEILKGLEPVEDVNLQLTVVQLELLPTASEILTSRQAYFQLYKDINTTAEVKAKLEWSNSLSGKEIEVCTKNGVVTLSGEVDYAANKAMAEMITAKIIQVQDVKNKITVNG